MQETLLVIDDEVIYLNMLVSILGDQYRILVAKNGEDGSRRARQQAAPDLVLLDVVMPGMDGYEVCRQLRADAALRDVPVVFLTARTDAEDEALGLELGAQDYITKPFSPAIVKARIRTHLSLRRARMELRAQNQLLEDKVRDRTRKLRRLSSEIAFAEERERRRIAGELHDGPTQRLALAKIQLSMLRGKAGPDLHGAFDQLLASLDLAIGETRTLMAQLSPPVFYELGLAPAIDWLGDFLLSPHAIGFRLVPDDGFSSLEEEIRILLFQAVRELITNIVKHAGATRVWVDMGHTDNQYRISVNDNGRGFPVEPQRVRPEEGGFGLFSIRERLTSIGGNLAITHNQHTCVTLTVPAPNGKGLQR